MRLDCGNCGESLILPPLRGDEEPCEACGNPHRFSIYHERTIFRICERLQCGWDAADALGLDRRLSRWCGCAREEKP